MSLSPSLTPNAARLAPTRWFQSVAVRSFAIAFVATHIPLLGLLALVVTNPDMLTPWGVMGTALGATVLAAIVVIYLLWRLFRPLREAADALVGFMSRAEPLRLTPGGADEVGRLVQVLTRSLAHLERSRAPLLQSGGQALQRHAAMIEKAGGKSLQSLVLVEVDQWQSLDEEGKVKRLEQVQLALQRRLKDALDVSELLLPWGRGRFLMVLTGTPTQAFERASHLCTPFTTADRPTPYTFSAAVEGRTGSAAGWSSALQRLELKLYTLRLNGNAAQVV